MDLSNFIKTADELAHQFGFDLPIVLLVIAIGMFIKRYLNHILPKFKTGRIVIIGTIPVLAYAYFMKLSPSVTIMSYFVAFGAYPLLIKRVLLLFKRK